MIPGIFVTQKVDDAFLDSLNKATREWEAKAAKCECGWICASCCVSFPNGMPNACEHGDEGCTKIIMKWKEHVKAV